MFAMLLWLQDVPNADAAERARDCAAAQGDEIIVCRRKDDGAQYRLQPLPERYVQSNRAEVDAAGGKLAVEAEQGRYDPRVMVRFRIPF